MNTVYNNFRANFNLNPENTRYFAIPSSFIFHRPFSLVFSCELCDSFSLVVSLTREATNMPQLRNDMSRSSMNEFHGYKIYEMKNYKWNSNTYYIMLFDFFFSKKPHLNFWNREQEKSFLRLTTSNMLSSIEVKHA